MHNIVHGATKWVSSPCRTQPTDQSRSGEQSELGTHALCARRTPRDPRRVEGASRRPPGGPRRVEGSPGISVLWLMRLRARRLHKKLWSAQPCAGLTIHNMHLNCSQRPRALQDRAELQIDYTMKSTSGITVHILISTL